MARTIAGRVIPGHKHIEIGLTSIFGIGRSTAKKICEEIKVDPSTKVDDVEESIFQRIRDAIGKYTTEGDLRRLVSSNIKRLIDIGSYRGMRHRRGLPCRGQNTHNNARTRKRRRRD